MNETLERNADCPKCGAMTYSVRPVRYHQGFMDGASMYVCGCERQPSEEHLGVTCEGCGYMWPIPCVGAEDE